MSTQAKKSAKAALHDPERKGLAAHGFRQKVAEIFEKLPGRDDK
jgi:pyruvate dehydrogenase (quinone)